MEKIQTPVNNHYTDKKSSTFFAHVPKTAYPDNALESIKQTLQQAVLEFQEGYTIEITITPLDKTVGPFVQE